MKRLAIVAATVLVTNAAWAQPQYDLLLKGGHVIDPRSDINRRMDVAIAAGKIARVADTIPASDARRVVDVSGLFVTPGETDTGHAATPTSAPSWRADSHAHRKDSPSYRAGLCRRNTA